MIVLDSSAIVALIRDEEPAGRIAELLAFTTERLAVSSVTLLETTMVIGNNVAEPRAPIDQLLRAHGVEVLAFTPEHAPSRARRFCATARVAAPWG